MRVFITAGEPSGDKLGAALMVSLKKLLPSVEFVGLGGQQMAAQGLESLFPTGELSVMGLAEVLPRYFSLKSRIKLTSRQVIDTKPDVLITIDSPDFSFRVAKRVKASSKIRTVHYVAPTVWAWRPGRAARISRYVDQVLALFPFEPPYFTSHGIDCDFVGHPIVSEPVATQAEIAEFRRTEGIGDAPVLLVLPGSRTNEVSRLAEVFGEAASLLQNRFEDLRVLVPVAEPVWKEVKKAMAEWPLNATLIEPALYASDVYANRKRTAFRAADIALAASGTISLELAAARTPMVIGYKMHGLSYQIIRHLALVDTATLVNLVSDTRVVPEFFGSACRPDALVDGLQRVLANPAPQLAAMQIALERLGADGEAPSMRAAKAILNRL